MRERGRTGVGKGNKIKKKKVPKKIIADTKREGKGRREEGK